jgi:DNA-binding NtrC family response regulator
MRLAACTPGDVIAEDDLWQESAEPARKPEAPPGQRTTLKKAIEELERSMIADALRTTRGNQWQAARMLGLSRQGLINKIKRYALG